MYLVEFQYFIDKWNYASVYLKSRRIEVGIEAVDLNITLKIFLSARRISFYLLPKKWRDRNKPQQNLLQGKRLANNSHRKLPAKRNRWKVASESRILIELELLLCARSASSKKPHICYSARSHLRVLCAKSRNTALGPCSIALVSVVSSRKQVKSYRLRARICSRN